MSFLAQGLTSGFGLGFSAAQQAKDRKERKQFTEEQRALQEKLRAEDRAERERAAQIAAELRLAEEMRGRAERADYRAEDREWREMEREDRLISGAGSRAKDQLDAAWRAQTANMSGPREQVEMALVRERIAGEKLRNDALANPKQTEPFVTKTWEEVNETDGSPIRYSARIPASQFGTLNSPDNPPVNSPGIQFDKQYEGREVTGPDGKRYIIKNGTPVLK